MLSCLACRVWVCQIKKKFQYRRILDRGSMEPSEPPLDPLLHPWYFSLLSTQSWLALQSVSVTKYPWVLYERQDPLFWGASSSWQLTTSLLNGKTMVKNQAGTTAKFSGISPMGSANYSMETLRQNILASTMLSDNLYGRKRNFSVHLRPLPLPTS